MKTVYPIRIEIVNLIPSNIFRCAAKDSDKGKKEKPTDCILTD